VTAAAPHVPQPLADQVAPGGGGRLVIPIGDLASQELVIWERGSDGTPRERRAGGVRFVPLISRPAFTEEPGWRGLTTTSARPSRRRGGGRPPPPARPGAAPARCRRLRTTRTSGAAPRTA